MHVRLAGSRSFFGGTMKDTFLMLFSLNLMSCFGCSDKDKEPYEGRLDRDYEIVIAHAVPDEDREVPLEVFVGRLLAIYPDSTDAANLQDYMMQIQLRAYVDEYRGLLKYHDDAEVFMTAGTQTVRLQNVGKGTYRDISNELHITGLQTCSLRVARPGGHVYQATIKVPDNISITSIAPGDTVVVYPKKDTPESSICSALIHVAGPPVAGGYWYRFRMPYVIDEPDLVFLLSINQGPTPFTINECGDIAHNDVVWTSMALDTILTRAWGMRETTGFEPRLLDSLNFWRYNAPIEYRSNITDEKGEKIAGYFGAYNSVKTHFVMKALRDSCTCD